MCNFLIGGRLGDAVHALYVARNTPGKHNLFITDRRDLHSDGFLFDLQTTYEELLPIISTQDYCNCFKIFNNQFAILEEGEAWAAIREAGTNLSMWRRYAYSASWTQLLSNTFHVPINGEPWIKMPEKLPWWEDKIVIHSSANRHRKAHHWNIVMRMYEGQCVFVGNKEEYNSFEFKIPFYQPKDLFEHFQIIGSCKFFIGNQSAPLAMAHSLGVPRLAMLNEIDKLHYTGEEKFQKEFYWIAKDEYYFPAFNLETA